jgi:transposase
MMKRRERAWSKWRKLVSKQSESGQSVAAFCRQRKLSVPQLYAWRRRLQEAKGGKFVEVKVKEPADCGAEREPGAIEVRLRKDRRLLVDPGFDAGHLRALIEALEAVA